MFGEKEGTIAKVSVGIRQNNTKPANDKQSRKKLWALGAGIALIALLVGVLMAPQGTVTPQDSDSLLQLGIKYTVGEHMVYNSTGRWVNTIDVVGFDGQRYSLDENSSGPFPETGGYYTSPTITPTLTIAKSDYYKNFLPEGQPSIFNNVETNPVLAAYVAKTSVNVGDVWTIPVWGGEVILKFSRIQNTTVPAGTYQTFAMEISSRNLTVNSNSSSAQDPFGIQYMTYQINGTTYLEQSTCRLIKFNLTEQQITFYTNGTNDTRITDREKLLVEHELP